MGKFGTGKGSVNDVSDSSLRHMMQIYGARNENELRDILSKESETLPCCHCGKEYPIDAIIIFGGEPYHKDHLKYVTIARR